MKRLLKVLPVLVFVSGIAGTGILSAQDAKKPEETKCGKMCPATYKKTGNMGERLSKKLGLTAEQKARVDEIIKSKMDRMEQERKACREKMESIKTETDAQITAILTPEQKTKFEELRKNRENKEHKRTDKCPAGKKGK